MFSRLLAFEGQSLHPWGLSAPAWAADVVSSNVVGYQKLTLQAGYNLIANGFRVVGTENAPDLQNMFSDAGGNATGTMYQETSDNLQTWSGTGYDTYWFYDGGDDDPTYDKKWYSAADDSTPTLEDVGVSEGAWYIARNAATLTIAGQVGTNAVMITISNGYNLMANPFPAPLALNDPSIDWSAMGVVGTMYQETSDNLQTWSGTGYNTYWFYDGGDDDPTYDKKWYSAADDSTPTQDPIPAGAGAWFIHQGSGATLVLPSPL